MNDWKVARLGSVAHVVHGWAFKGEGFAPDTDASLPIVVSIGNFDYGGGFRFSDSAVKRYAAQYPQEYELKAGDLLLVMTCQTEGGEILGVPAMVPDDGRTYLHNQRLGKLVIDRPDLLDHQFMYQLARTPDFNRQLFVTATGSKILHTSPNRIEATTFPCPPLGEQQAIAEVLGALDDKIAASTKLTTTTANLATSHFSHANQYADRSFSLSDLVSTQYGITTSAHDEPGPKFLRVTDINKKPWIEWDSTPNCTVSDAELHKYRVSAGDILVARMADPGKAAFIDVGDPEAVFASYLVRLKTLDPDQALYLYYFMRSPQYLEYAQGAMSGSVQKNMNAKVIVATSVGLPEPSRILQFNETVVPLRRLIQSYLDENRRLTSTRDALLPQLMSGKLRIKDAERVLEDAGV
ncbi:restriction endonuclease subunit S [Arthrobacter sp. DNA4]|uniref:restriction endonuclease subunit S n=1 Tax=Arthrobacter sp. DNA4 TaxID=2963432 RepID=UPI0020CF53FA|nr:restriction endonuclease subunit S [Arthrobacter sp. DNA4]UTT68035.1 restriction endonuclease subunit S [Arthrobacter sp. DNA4]